MNDDAELFTTGQRARRTGVPVRTIPFWSDATSVSRRFSASPASHAPRGLCGTVPERPRPQRRSLSL